MSVLDLGTAEFLSLLRDCRPIMLIGGRGQLGSELVKVGQLLQMPILPFSSSQLDITDRSRVAKTIASVQPDTIINAAAYTDVDRAETNQKRAFAVNAGAVQTMAGAANEVGAFFFQLSTDYVFDGQKSRWYDEADTPNPTNVYGASKAEGEQATLEANQSVVLRTSWLYSSSPNNFVSKIASAASKQDELRVVNDQKGCPTSVVDLARVTLELVRRRHRLAHRIYHVAAPDDATWFELAEAVVSEYPADIRPRVRATSSEEHSSPATRPINSRLSTQRLEEEIGHQLPSWRSSLPPVAKALTEQHRQNVRRGHHPKE